MAADPFLTTTLRDFEWPYPKPFCAVVQQPPLNTKPRGPLMARPKENACNCELHGWNPLLERYRCLAEKEKTLVKNLCELKKDMTDVNNQMLDNPCDDDDTKMKTTFQADFTHKKSNKVEYKRLMAAVDSKVGTPIPPRNIELGNGYRDPTSFRYSPIVRPDIDPCRTVTFLTVPETVDQWFQQYPGRTEYQDTISRTGGSIILSSQQYLEPLPSSRRRFGDPNR